MRTIGRYEICGLLGRGGMSLVYKVRLPVIEKIMALKLLHPPPILVNLLGEEELKKRFINEAVIMAKLHHPNLLAVWDFDEWTGTPFFVMEYYCNNLGTLIGESGEVEQPTRLLKLERIFHYSIGVTFYRLATGRLPREDRREPSRLNPELDTHWDAFLLKGAASDQRARFASAEEMLLELERRQRHWEATRERACYEAPVPMETTPKKTSFTTLRSQPVKVRPAEARPLFDIDRLWRPRRFHPPHWQEPDDGTVSDRSHGLLWEQSGSDYALTWPEAEVYVQGLNRERSAGREDWRLPTVDELLSLITETPQIHSYCLAPPFDPAQRCLWSADRRSFNAAWFVSIDLGFVFWQDFTCHYYVRAVCSL